MKTASTGQSKGNKRAQRQKPQTARSAPKPRGGKIDFCVYKYGSLEGHHFLFFFFLFPRFRTGCREEGKRQERPGERCHFCSDTRQELQFFPVHESATMEKKGKKKKKVKERKGNAKK
jgi:hypothetical protein